MRITSPSSMCFNGATAIKAVESLLQYPVSSLFRVLQWGYNLSGCRRRSSLDFDAKIVDASMGPQPCKLRKCGLQPAHRAHLSASMGPQVWSCGNGHCHSLTVSHNY